MSHSRRHLIRAAAAAALATLLAGCGAPEMVALAAACAPGMDGRQVAVQGFVNADKAMTCNTYTNDVRCGLDLTELAGGGATAGVNILVGTGPDAMDEPPMSYSSADVHIRADDGAPVTVGDRVLATGRISVATRDVCFVTVEKIVKA